MTLKFLGTGTSVGVPQIGCGCKVCTSSDPRDRRRRSGAYVTAGDKAFLIDTPPELRLACIEYAISKVDAVVLTHAHMDHVAAFDDIRRFNTINGGVVLPCYALPETIFQMHKIFPYISSAKGEHGLFRPQVDFIDSSMPFSIGDVRLESVRVEHGFPCTGYLMKDTLTGGRLGYVSDCRDMSDGAVEKFYGVDVMVLDCLRVRDHSTHMNLERALGYANKICAKKTYFTHMCHDFTHEEWLAMLPDGIAPAYDGMEITV